MIPGETVLSGAEAPATQLTVLRSGAGFYVGYLDEDGLPYSRETHYFETENEAETALAQIERSKGAGEDPRSLAFVR